MSHATPLVEAPSKLPLRFRRTRIAVSVLFGLPAMLLIVLWLRSYSWFDSYNSGQHRLTSLVGNLYVDEQFSFIGVHPKSWQRHIDGESAYVLFQLGKSAAATPHGTGWRLPFLLLFVVGLIPCGIPWLPWSNRFSLTTLLVATTLVAVALGLGGYAFR